MERETYLPSNTTSTTAVVVTTLPYTVLQTDINDTLGVTQTVWYKYTADADDIVIGAFGFGDLTTYRPRTRVYIESGGSPVAYLNIVARNKAVQFPVVDTETYYLSFESLGGNVTPAELSLNIQNAPNLNAPIGSILVNDDTDGFPLVILSSSTGAVLQFQYPFPAGEAGDVLENGLMLVEDNDANTVVVYDTTFTVVTTHAIGNSPCIRACHGADNFYVARQVNPVVVHIVDSTGALSGTTHTLTAVTTVKAIAAANDESVLYHALNTSGSAVKQWDLVGGAALADLAAGLAGYYIPDILVLADDTIIVLFVHAVFGTTQVRRFNASGTLLNTYDMGDSKLPAGTNPRLAYSVDDPDSFWVWTHDLSPDVEGISRFREVQVSDGTILSEVESTEYETGIYEPDTTATPITRFGNSFSCPFFLIRAESPGSGGGSTTGEIIVRKVTVPSTDSQSFAFTAGGGLSPGSFNLSHGQQQAYNPVTPGSGYTIAETEDDDYDTSSSVSNGSTIGNITVTTGESVVVTFTNTRRPHSGSGVYRVVPEKVWDTLYTNLDPVETEDVAIPRPYIKSALLGD